MNKNGLSNPSGKLPGFAESAEDELQYCFALSNTLIEQRVQNEKQNAQKASARGEDVSVGVAHQLRLRLLQEMLLEQVPSLRRQEAGAK